MPRYTRKILLLLLVCWAFLAGGLRGQNVMVHGAVFNMYKTKPLEGVSVLSTSGRGTATDSNGNYALLVKRDDSIYFSYLGKATARYPVAGMNLSGEFDIALHVDPVELKEVRVMPRNYRMDSLQNRKDYAKIFNFKKPGFKINDVGNAGVGLGVGIDLDELINMFRFQRTRRILAFQHRLLDEEQDKFIDYRFSPSVVLKITHLTGDELDTFMIRYRPSYEFCKKSTDYDLYDYIKLAFQEYQKDRKEKP
ncbi:MAG TPA: carboxypeptidase-like regulatory domain-containing protein [Puia sp.]|nr:carboxypeptidase-like regulatory domain-containing protein [Puia sp.]